MLEIGSPLLGETEISPPAETAHGIRVEEKASSGDDPRQVSYHAFVTRGSLDSGSGLPVVCVVKNYRQVGSVEVLLPELEKLTL